MTRMNILARRFFTGERSSAGAALVELAVTLPVLVAVLIGTVDFARVFYVTIELENAARAGAQYGGHDSIQAMGTAQIKAAAQSAVTPDLGTVTIAVGQNAGCPPVDQASPTCRCFQDNGTPGSPAGPVACTTTCSSGSHLVETITVTAYKRFDTFARFPGIPRPLNICRSATFRVAL